MNKKYLLYIHDPRFSTEVEKSKLVNKLLTNHYDGVYTNKPKSVYTPPEQLTNVYTNPDESYCKHGHIIPAGRDKCTDKHCKYS